MAIEEMREAKNYLEAEKAEMIANIKTLVGKADGEAENIQERLVVLKVSLSKLDAAISWAAKI